MVDIRDQEVPDVTAREDRAYRLMAAEELVRGTDDRRRLRRVRPNVAAVFKRDAPPPPPEPSVTPALPTLEGQATFLAGFWVGALTTIVAFVLAWTVLRG